MNYLVYKTINKINKREYIGVHKQEGLDFDGYFGSGRLVINAVNKYGKENFIRETLFSYTTPEEAYRKEAELVNENYIELDSTYNIGLGGIRNSGIYLTRNGGIERAKATRKAKGLDQCKHMNTPEIQERAVKNARRSVIKNSLEKYPILNSIVEFIDTDGSVIMKGNLYKISKEIYGRTRAVSHHTRLLTVLKTGKPFVRGTHKGRYIRLLESSTTSA